MNQKPLVNRMHAEVARFCTEILQMPIPQRPQLLSQSRFDFAMKFMQEELTEFEEAHNRKDVAEAIDALIDLVYVALGRLLEMGVPPGLPFQEVQDKNMQKVRGVTKRGHQGDAVKPENWTPPDFFWLINTDPEDWHVLKHRPEGARLSWVFPGQKTHRVPAPINPDPIVHHDELKELRDAKVSGLAMKVDAKKKPQTALIPYEALAREAEAWGYGAYQKYGEWDWTKGRPFTEVASSAHHHIGAWLDREKIDPESACHHLGLARCNIGMLIAWEAMGRTDLDNRRPAPTVTEHRPDGGL